MLHDFATFRRTQGNLHEAVSFYQRALAIREQVYGPQHPKTTETRERLRAVLVALGQTEEAARLDVAQPEKVVTEGEHEARRRE